MKSLHYALAGLMSVAIALSGTHSVSATELEQNKELPTIAEATQTGTTITSDLDCSVSAAWGLYKFNQKSQFSTQVELPESVKAGTSFDALIKINDVSVDNENLSSFKSAKLTKSSIRINVGKNVKLDGEQPGISISNGILSIDNRLQASLQGNSLKISADPIKIRLQALAEGELKFTPENVLLTNTASIDSYTAYTTCTTNLDKPFATTKIEPADGISVTIPKYAKVGDAVTVTATLPKGSAVDTNGKVQFFVNHVASGDPIPVADDNKVSSTLRFDTSGSTTITARYFDAESYNPIPDGKAILPVITKFDAKQTPDVDDYTGMINGTAASLDAPAKVKPGQKVSVSASLLPSTAPVRIYEIGINAPDGVKYVEETGKTEYSSTIATKGTVFTAPGYGYFDPSWEKESNRPNDSYRGFHSSTSYSVINKTPQTVTAEFEIPETLAPGIYMFQMGTYKYTTGFKGLVSIPETAFEIAGPELPELPPRNIKPIEQDEPGHTDSLSSNSVVKSPWFWTGIIGAVAGIAALVYKFFFAPR